MFFFEKIFAVFEVRVHIPVGKGFDILGGPRRSHRGWRLRRRGFKVSSPRHGEQGTGTVVRQGAGFFIFSGGPPHTEYLSPRFTGILR